MNSKIPPIKSGEIIDVVIDSIGRKGDGVGKYNNFIIMVPQAVLGNSYRVKVTDIHETFAFGLIMEVL